MLQNAISSQVVFHEKSRVNKFISSLPHVNAAIHLINEVKKDFYLDCPAGVDLLLVKALPLLAVLVLIKEDKSYPLPICKKEVRGVDVRV